MKKLFLIALFATVSAATFAAGDIKVTKDSSAIFKVYYTKPLKAKVSIQIFNEGGERVFKETVNSGSKGFVRPYNLSELPTGTYTFKVNDGNEESTFKFDFKENTTSSNMMAMINKLGEERVFMALSNKQKSNVSIKIYAANEVIYESNETVDGQFAQLFNLKDVQLDTVIFRVYEGNQLIKEASF